MQRYAPALIALALAITVVACTDTPAPSSKGNRAVGGEVQEVAESKPAPETEAGVVPDLIEVTLADSKKALADAGFETVRAETASTFGTVDDDLLVCVQDPKAGSSLPRDTRITLVVDRSC